MIHSITIDNFRGIKHLDINGFRKVNLLVGKNGSGKSTVLESLLITSFKENMDDWFYFVSKKHARWYNERWSSLIHKMDFENHAQIQVNNLGIPRFVTINAKPNANLTVIVNYPMSDPLIFEYDYKFDSQNKRKIRFLSTGFPAEILETFHEEFAEIQQNRQIPKLVDILRNIDPNISDLRLSLHSIVEADISNLPQTLAVQFLGDGMIRLIGILMRLYNNKNGIVLIDEIESGFHYSSLEVMWKAVFAAAKEFKVQVFATTHSWECVDAFSRHSELNGEDTSRVIRIEKHGEEMRAVGYEPEILETAMERRMEVR